MVPRTFAALTAALTLASVLMIPADAAAQRRRRRPPRRDNTQRTTQDARANSTSNASADEEWGSSSGSAGTSAQSSGSASTTGQGTEASGPAAEPSVPTPVAPRPAAIDVSLGARWYGRFFAYHQDVFGELRGYDLAAAPSLNATIEWYPGAHVSSGPASWFGIIAQGAYVVGVSSRDSRDMSYGTTALSFDVGLRFRVPIGLHDLGLHATYGQQHFSIENNGGGGAEQQDPGVPGVQYQSLRFGASVRLGASERVAILLGASGMPLLGAGDIAQNYFRRATAAAVEAQLGVSIALLAGLELRIIADARRYFFSMNPALGDRWIAGGALDHHLSAGAALAFRR